MHTTLVHQLIHDFKLTFTNFTQALLTTQMKQCHLLTLASLKLLELE